MLEKFVRETSNEETGGDDNEATLPQVPISRGDGKGSLINSTYQYVSQYDTSFAADIEGAAPQVTALP